MIRLHAPLAPVITTLWPWLSVPTIDEDVLEAYRREGSEQIRLCRSEIEAMGIRVAEAPLTAHSRFARHDGDKLAAALMALFREHKKQ